MRRSSILFLFFLCLFGVVGSCDNTSCGCDPIPPITTSQLAYKWRLDEIRIANQITSSSAGIKDRFTIEFRPDGSYTQTLLADGTTFDGTWKIAGSGNRELRLIDHKKAPHDYRLSLATSTELRYGTINSGGKNEDYLFTRVP
jgi:hypothetical protein